MTRTSSTILPLFLLAYAAANVLHFVHNAMFLSSYPNMPDWISKGEVYGTLAALTAIGVLGYFLFLFYFRVVGLTVIGLYAASGFDGLAHYHLAPVSAHTVTMNLTIWLEVGTAALLLVLVVRLLATQRESLARRGEGSNQG